MGIYYSPKIVTDGLVLCLDAANPKSYPGSGTAWFDISGVGGSAVHNGVVTFTTEKSFKYLAGTDFSRFTRTDVNGGTWAYPLITLEIWIKPDDINLSASYVSNNIFTVESAVELSIGNLGNGYSGLAYASNPWAWYGANSNVLKNDEWNLVTYRHTLINRQLFVNGISVFDKADTGGIAAGSGGYPYITLMGRRAGTDAPAEGDLSIVKLYNRALTDEEIKQNFNATRGRFGI